jgi:hypothetical protein
MLCKECFFYNFTDKNCAERHTTPKEGESCHSFTPHVAIDFSYEDEVSDKVQWKVE